MSEPPVTAAGATRQPRVYVELWPSGGWVIRMAGHAAPVSRHDTEEEAEKRAESYRRGLARGA